MTQGSTASIKDMHGLPDPEEAPAARWPLRNHSLFGRLHTRQPRAGALSRPAREEGGCWVPSRQNTPGHRADLGEGAAAGGLGCLSLAGTCSGFQHAGGRARTRSQGPGAEQVDAGAWSTI